MNLTAYNDKTILAFNSVESFCNSKREKQTSHHIIVQGVSEMAALAVEKDYFKARIIQKKKKIQLKMKSRK